MKIRDNSSPAAAICLPCVYVVYIDHKSCAYFQLTLQTVKFRWLSAASEFVQICSTKCDIVILGPHIVGPCKNSPSGKRI